MLMMMTRGWWTHGGLPTMAIRRSMARRTASPRCATALGTERSASLCCRAAWRHGRCLKTCGKLGSKTLGTLENSTILFLGYPYNCTIWVSITLGTILVNWCFFPQYVNIDVHNMGFSENMVPLNALVNHHCSYWIINICLWLHRPRSIPHLNGWFMVLYGTNDDLVDQIYIMVSIASSKITA